MKREALDHPKMRRLRRALGVGKAQTWGHFEAMTHWVSKYADAGDVGRWPDDEIEEAVEWDGEPGRLVSAFVEAGFFDRHDEHRLVFHDWPEHANDSVHMKLARETRWFADGSEPKRNRLGGKERERVDLFFATNSPPSRHAHGVRTGSARDAHDVALPSPPLPSPPSPSLPAVRGRTLVRTDPDSVERDPAHAVDSEPPGPDVEVEPPQFALADAFAEATHEVDPDNGRYDPARWPFNRSTDARHMERPAAEGVTPEQVREEVRWVDANQHEPWGGFTIPTAHTYATKRHEIRAAMRKRAKLQRRERGDRTVDAPRRPRCRWHEEVDVRVRFGELTEHEGSREHELLERSGVRRCDDGQAYADRLRASLENAA